MPSIRRWKEEGLAVDGGVVSRNPRRSRRLCVWRGPGGLDTFMCQLLEPRLCHGRGFSSQLPTKWFFSSSSLSAIRVVSSAYLKLLIFLPAGNLDSSFCFIWPSIFHDVLCIEVKQTGWQYTVLTYFFPSWKQSVVPCPVLIVASCPTYRCVRRQVRWSDIPISWRIFHNLCGPHSQRLWPSQ